MAREIAGIPAYRVARECLRVSAPTLSQYESGRPPRGSGQVAVIEAWTRKIAAEHGRPDLIVRVIDWADEDDIALIRQYQPAMLEAS